METATGKTVKEQTSIVYPSVNTAAAVNRTAGAEGAAAAGTTNFSAMLAARLGVTGKQQVNEEELFAGIIGDQLKAVSPEAAAFYEEQLRKLSISTARPDGYVFLEDVAKEALKATVQAGMVTEEKAMMINAAAFNAAQLDKNVACLYDGRGETSATAAMEEAMFKVKQALDQIESGALTLQARSLDIPSNQGSTPGHLLTNGAGAENPVARSRETSSEPASGSGLSEKQVRFTWKHIASDGNLALLLPTRLNGSIDSVAIYKDGRLIEEGDYQRRTGDNRAVIRFNHPGSHYGRDVDVVIRKDDGTAISYHVDNGGQRTYVPQDDYDDASSVIG